MVQTELFLLLFQNASSTYSDIFMILFNKIIQYTNIHVRQIKLYLNLIKHHVTGFHIANSFAYLHISVMCQVKRVMYIFNFFCSFHFIPSLSFIFKCHINCFKVMQNVLSIIFCCVALLI